jgi:hypothetical protein
MPADRLELYESHQGYQIQWIVDGEPGLTLGEKDIKDITDQETVVACNAIMESDISTEVDSNGWYWETNTAARRALRVAREAIRMSRKDRSLPEWAAKALANGWKMPKGWKP